jgi:hypothetical protein
VYSNNKLMVYGGKTARTPTSMLSDLRVLDLNQQPPTWQLEAPRLLANSSGSGTTGVQQQPLLGLAGHMGGADADGCLVFFGGYRRYDVKEPQSVIQVSTMHTSAVMLHVGMCFLSVVYMLLFYSCLGLTL